MCVMMGFPPSSKCFGLGVQEVRAASRHAPTNNPLLIALFIPFMSLLFLTSVNIHIYRQKLELLSEIGLVENCRFGSTTGYDIG
jgi:hypothetical protein